MKRKKKDSSSKVPDASILRLQEPPNVHLHDIVRQGENTKVLEYLCSNGNQDVNETNKSGWGPLHIAVNLGYLDITQTLLKYGADVNKLNSAKNSALHLAIKRNLKEDNKAISENVRLVKHLLESGADISIKDGPTNKTAPELVLFWDRKPLFFLFNIKSPPRLRLPPIKLNNSNISKVGSSERLADVLVPFETNRDYQKLLHVYAEKGEDDILKEVLKMDGVSVNGLNEAGMTPLQIALEAQKWSTAEMLINNNAHTHINNNGEKRSPFYLAVRGQNWRLAKIILDQLHCPYHLEGLDLVLEHSDFTNESKNDDNINFIKALIDQIFDIPEEEEFLHSVERNLKGQRIWRLQERSYLRSQYIRLMTILCQKSFLTQLRRVFFSLNIHDQKSMFVSICIKLGDDCCVNLVKSIVLEADMYQQQSMVYKNKLNFRLKTPDQKTWFNEKDVNKLQEISGQVIRIMKQQYGDNDDSILSLLASTGKSEALSYMLTKNPAKAQVSNYELYAMENKLGQNLLVILQTQGSSMTKQKEEVLDLIKEKFQDRDAALTRLKQLLPTSSEAKETLVSCIDRFDLSLQQKINLIALAVIPWLLSTALWVLDLVTDVQVTLANTNCIFYNASSQEVRAEQETNIAVSAGINCTRFDRSDWLQLVVLSSLHIFLPFLVFLAFDILDSTRDQIKDLEMKGRRPFHCLNLLISPVTTKFMRMYQFLQYRFSQRGHKKNKLQSDFINVSKRMVVVAVTEASLEANFQLYINFILFLPNFIRLGMQIKEFTGISIDIFQNRSLSILTSFISLVWINTTFKVNSKKGALDFKCSPVARLLLMLTYCTEILARLMIISIFSYTSSDTQLSGIVNWKRSLLIFYGHVSFCFVLNIIFNDSNVKLAVNYKHPIFYLEALINAFSSIFTYSNYTIYNIQERQEEHQPSFIRQIIFQAIFFLEFTAMLVYSVLNSNQPGDAGFSIQDENGDRIPISEKGRRLILYSVIMIYFLGLFFRFVYYRLHPWMISIRPSAHVKVFGTLHDLRSNKDKHSWFLENLPSV